MSNTLDMRMMMQSWMNTISNYIHVSGLVIVLANTDISIELNSQKICFPANNKPFKGLLCLKPACIVIFPTYAGPQSKFRTSINTVQCWPIIDVFETFWNVFESPIKFTQCFLICGGFAGSYEVTTCFEFASDLLLCCILWTGRSFHESCNGYFFVSWFNFY